MLNLNMDDVGEATSVRFEGTLKEGNPMLGSVHLSSILLISLLVLSTHVLWAQRTSTLKETAVQLPDAPSRVAMVSQAPTSVHLSYKGLPLSFRQNQGQTESWIRFFSDEAGSSRRSINTTDVLNQDKTAEFWSKNKYFMGSSPTKWTFAPIIGHVHHETIHGTNDLEYYGHHIPWAGSVILQISKQARSHPHIASVLKAVHPRF